jgi:tight adherence protein B
MNTPMVVATCAFVSVSALVLLVSNLIVRKPAAVQRRLELHSVAIATGETKRQERIDVLKDTHLSGLPLGNKFLGRFRPARTAALELSRAHSALNVGPYLLMRLLIAILLFVVARLANQSLLFAIGGVALGLFAPRLWIRRQWHKRLKAFEGQLAEAIDLLVGSLRVGYGFLQGLESVSKEMGAPMCQELTQVIEQINVGINPTDALQEMTERLPSYDLALMVAAISVQRQTGGNLAEVLENLASTVRERRRVRGEVHALTTGPRVSSYVLGAIPVLLFAYFFSISTDYRLVMLGTTFGRMLLGLAAVLSSLGFFFSRRAAKVEY